MINFVPVFKCKKDEVAEEISTLRDTENYDAYLFLILCLSGKL